MQYLIPVSGEHSISRVIVTFFLPQPFLKPRDIFEKLKNDKNYTKYQRRNLTKLRKIDLTNNQNITNEIENGFVFEEFDIQTGKLKNIFRILNNSEKQASISLETRIYKDWKSFKSRVIKDIKSFSDTFEFYVEALSLSYIDEFIWNSTDKRIDVNSIFSKESEILNTRFKNSDNGTLILISQNDVTNKKEEKTEISFSNKIKRVTINHQYADKFDSLETFEKLNNAKVLTNSLDNAHKSNKDILKDVLSIKSQKLINL